MKEKSRKWTVEFEVCDSWVADGFNITEERALAMIENALGGYAREGEFTATVIDSPDSFILNRIRGYTSQKCPDCQKLDDYDHDQGIFICDKCDKTRKFPI